MKLSVKNRFFDPKMTIFGSFRIKWSENDHFQIKNIFSLRFHFHNDFHNSHWNFSRNEFHWFSLKLTSLITCTTRLKLSLKLSVNFTEFIKFETHSKLPLNFTEFFKFTEFTELLVISTDIFNLGLYDYDSRILDLVHFTRGWHKTHVILFTYSCI